MTTILVTRPEGQADHLIAALEQAGYHCLHRPLMAIEAVAEHSEHARLARARMLDLDLYQHVIAISANAARSGLEWLDTYWPQPPLGVHWYGVGPASTEPFWQYGLEASCPASRYDSEGLLALPALQQVAEQRILIWRGVGGRETLATTLRARGACVDYAELYERRPRQYSSHDWDVTLGTRPWLLLSSGQALDIIERQVPTLANRIAGLILPSERIAEQARAKGYDPVLVPASARDDDMLSCLAAQL
ncbi:MULTISPECIES: uroporphyrinogen-III synthase [unclassified Oceanobacter]|uniref:uroporphyrinogen-III synthase n=1 Tax=unclassified Oceanobacter TaxID=2620260 RepID=UPI002734A5AC|nr:MULTISPECIES: uroporphyrinogen-III synthase [unclassified Oceanobacter]MDP2504587.1 uroporphyrinogen-III synthase [Oceanobacter sp. 3_MG-2023]MDP2546960.1 uroporphyrinogen-III synthase [Oceanobacter sp. 4_MG-2023]